MKHFIPAAHAALATAWPFNNILRRRIGQVKNLCLTACLLLTAFTAQAVTITWDGSAGTNWNTPDNWTPAVVPTASDDVQIETALNQPVIGANTAAMAQSVWVKTGSSLTIAATGSLTINGSRYFSGFTAGFYNEGTVSNTGKMILGSTASLGHYGLLNAATFNNNSGGEISIDRSTERGLFNLNGTFTNSAKITIGAVANVGLWSIYNNGSSTFNNNTCTALINIAANATLNNLGTFNNSGNIIENASGNSSVTTNSGNIQNLNGGTFSVTGSSTGLNTALTGAIWTGCVSTDWATAGNWIGGTVPTASDNVTIPNMNNDPIVLAGTAAVAKSVVVQVNALLELNASSSLAISGSTADGLSSEGTVTSEGFLSISSAGGIGFYNGGIFNNNGAGELHINGTVGDGLFQWDATLNNTAKIKVGNTGSIGGFGINNRHSTFNNNAGGDLTVDRTASDGIFVFTGSLNNVANITIGGLATVGASGILSGAVVNNNTGGTILIDRTGGSGIHVSFGAFNNRASLKIGSTATIGSVGISCQSGTFNNFPGGEITIDRTISDGITNYYRSPFRDFGNSGKIFIGKTAAIGGHGIQNEAVFNNNSDGEITIDRTAESGIYVGDDYDSNTPPALFSNSGQLAIGGTAPLGDNGIQNRVTFNNNASGQIWIDRTASDGLFNAAGDFSNAGQVTIGANAAPMGDGLENAATFNNQTCGEIALHDNLVNDSTFTNMGLLRVNTALAHTNSGTFTNDGIIEFPQGNPIPGVINNDVIVQPVSGECSVANALQVGSSNSFAIGTIWYKNQGLSVPAGAYDPATNTFTANGLAEGSTYTLYFSVSNGTNGCTRTVSVRLTYDDVTRPTIACPPSTTLNTSDDGGADCTVTLTYATPQFSDNCDGTGPATYVSGPTSGTSLSLNGSPYTVVHSYTDLGGNAVADNCTFTIVVKDNTAPTFTCPAPPLTLYTNGATNCSVTIPDLVNMVNNAADNCALRVGNPVTQSVPAGAYTGAVHGQAIPITVTVWDNASPANSTACTLTFTVNDNDAPSITCPGNIARNTALGQCNAIVSYENPLFWDNCTASLTRTSPVGTASGSSFPAGTTPVVWQATDAAGNTAGCSFTITVTDWEVPTITCPPNLIRPTDAGQCGAVVSYVNPTYFDNCSSTGLDHISGGLSGSTFPKGTTTVVWMATDAANNTQTCSFAITVTDSQAPSITCPANIAKGTDPGQCTAVVAYNNPSYSDNCPGAGLDHISGGLSGGPFPKGATTVIWMATDAAGLTKTCTFRIIVSDTQAPTIVCPAAVSVPAAAGQCSAVVAYTIPTATDNCAPAPTVVRIGGTASGSTVAVGGSTAIWRAIDGAGRSSTCSVAISVVDNQAPTVVCPQNIVQSNPANACNAPVFYTNPSATDNCGVNSLYLVSGMTNGSAFPVGTTTVTWRANDVNGLSATCSFAVTVTCGSARFGGSGGVNFPSFKNLESLRTGDGAQAWNFALTPNPARDAVQIAWTADEAKPVHLSVFDAQGRLVCGQTFAEGDQTSRLDVSNWAAGVYLVALKGKEGTTTKRLVVTD